MHNYQTPSRRPIAQAFRKTAAAAVDFCVRRNIHPDVVSLSSIVASAGAGVCFWQGARLPGLLLLGAALCGLRLWLNMLDGMVALASGKASARGEIFNELPDRLSDVIIFVGVAHSGLGHPLWGYWAAILALVTAYVGTLGQAVGAGRQFGGVMSKPWRMVAVMVGAGVTTALFWLGHGSLALGGWSVLDWTCLVVVVGCLQTIWVRLVRMCRVLREPLETHATPTAAPGRTATEHTMTSWDGTKLFYRVWAPSAPSDRAVVLFHRGHEHSGRCQDLVDRLAMDDFWMFAWDARGHGCTEGERGYAPSFDALVRDVDCFVRHIVDHYGVSPENMAIIANSIGAVLVSTWVHDYAPRLRAMVLATPALRVKLYIPLAIPGLRLLQRLKGKAYVTSYVRPSMLTHDPDVVRQYSSDPLITRNIAVNILLEMHDTSRRLLADAGAIHLPTLVLSAGTDWVIRKRPQRQFFDGLSSKTKEMVVYDGFYHGLLYERQRDRPIAKTRAFLAGVFDRPLECPSLLDADQRGATKEAYDRLRRPLSPGNPRGAYYAGMKLMLRTVGQQSEGIRIGCRTGFNSGPMLDHVYRNQAMGRTSLGRLIDRIYLDSVGWRGVRQRKVLLEQLLQQAIRTLHESGREVRLLDIASGPGRYVLDTLRRLNGVKVRGVLRDRDRDALAEGRKMAAELGLADLQFQEGDAFDERALANIEPHPNLAIVSGLFELFPENGPVAGSLRGLAAAVEHQGLLIYTNQPWHPQLELISRSLTGTGDRPWTMRCRSQLEMDQLVENCGFQKLQMLASENGIFTVSLARRD